ncbi:MAG TPA: glycosyltransferase family 4 protein [Fimbriimonadaceae bacterium]|nr:glycosyltransferase family 4 protein [Fimbriimonadaceae bacterium]
MPIVACLSKSPRASLLFSELAALDSSYRDLGFVSPSRKALVLGALGSLASDSRMVRLDARRSPQAARSLAQACQAKLDELSEPIEAVLYWGATNWPGNPPDTPFFLITDGPFDPRDPTYPVEWIPRRWPEGYFNLQSELFRRAEHVFTLSEWARTKILELHGVVPGKVTRIGWGPIGSIGGPMISLPPGTRYFLAVGHEWARKGMDLIADAGRRIHARQPDVQTILVGQPEGCEIPPMPGVVQVPHGLPMHVVHQLMRCATAVVVASRFDASPHVIYEALQYGTPVIGSRVCGIPEAISEPLGGHSCEPGSVDSVEEAMQMVLERDPVEARTSARGTYEKSGGWARCAERVHGVISAWRGDR